MATRASEVPIGSSELRVASADVAAGGSRSSRLVMPRTSAVAVALGVVVAALLALGILVAVIEIRDVTFPARNTFTRLFDVDAELNVPSMVSVLGLGACGALLALVTAVRRAGGGAFLWHWRLLALGFVVMAIDEGAGIHEAFSKPLGEVWIGSFYIRWSWVLFAVPGVLLLGLIYIPFVRHLPRRTATGFMVAGTTYLTGAVGMEFFSGDEPESGRSRFLRLFEESLEMFGIALFFVVLWSYARRLPWRFESGHSSA